LIDFVATEDGMGFIGNFSAPACGIIFLVVTLLHPHAAPAIENSWSAVLASPLQGDTYHPSEPLTIGLPADIDNETIQWLALELDAIDVTRIVALKGADVILQPPQPLAPGIHSIRLVQYTREGQIIERGRWEFETRGAATYQLVSEVSLNAYYRVADGDIPEEQFPEHRTTGDGGARFQGMVARDDWKVSGALDMIYNSEPGPSLDEVEGGDFLIEGVKGPVTLDLGHHTLGPDSLVMENFHRRGGSLSYAAGSRSIDASGFVFRTEPVNGFRNGFGVSDENNRVTGGIVTTRPFPGKGDLLSISGIYLYGEQGTDPGVAVIDDQAAGEGNAWSLALESLLWDQRVTLRGEYAETRFDPDGPGTETGKATDDALFLRGVLVPWTNLSVKDRPFHWDFGAEYQKVGTLFHSLANPGLPSDLEMMRGFSTLSWSGLSLEAVVGREEDNVDGLDFLPTTRSDLVALSGTYAFFSDVQEGIAAIKWLGRPVLSISAQQAWDRTDEIPQDYEGGVVDQRIRDFQVSLGSTYPTWDWYAGHTRGWQDDFTGDVSDIRSDVSDLSLNLKFGSRVTLGGRGQLNKIREEETGLEFEANLAGVDGSFVLVKDRVTARLSYQVDTQEATEGSVDEKTETTDFDVDWSLIKAVRNRPGLSLWLRGQYREVNDRTGEAPDIYPYQIFCGFTVGWPYSYPAAF
jgi:hypothetical protein